MNIFFGPRLHEHYAARPLTLVDVGARGGLQPNWRPAASHLRVVAFEPDPEEFARLTQRSAPGGRTLYINTALHRAPAELTLNAARNPGTSSLLEPNHPFLTRFPEAERFDVLRRIPLRVDALDSVLAANGIAHVDFLKIDTQGAELAILEGARNTVAEQAFGVELEVNFAPLYLGQPSFGELDTLLRALGLQLMDIRPAYWKRAYGARYGGPKGQLVFADALYFKTEDRFQAHLERIADVPARRSALLSAMSVSLLYGYVDYALELLRPNERLFEPDVTADIVRELHSDVRLSTRLPHFRGRGYLSHLFYRLHRLFFPTHGGWASGGRHLGNVE
jgi:FkbM family methyltransferase